MPAAAVPAPADGNGAGDDLPAAQLLAGLVVGELRLRVDGDAGLQVDGAGGQGLRGGNAGPFDHSAVALPEDPADLVLLQGLVQSGQVLCQEVAAGGDAEVAAPERIAIRHLIVVDLDGQGPLVDRDGDLAGFRGGAVRREEGQRPQDGGVRNDAAIGGLRGEREILGVRELKAPLPAAGGALREVQHSLTQNIAVGELRRLRPDDLLLSGGSGGDSPEGGAARVRGILPGAAGGDDLADLHGGAAGEGVAVDDAAAELLVDVVHHHDAHAGVLLGGGAAGGEEAVVIDEVVDVLRSAQGRETVAVAGGLAGVVEDEVLALRLHRAAEIAVELLDGVGDLRPLVAVRALIVVLDIDLDGAAGADLLGVVLVIVVAAVPLREIRTHIAIELLGLAAAVGKINAGHHDDPAADLPQCGAGHPALRHAPCAAAAADPVVKALRILGNVFVEDTAQGLGALALVAAVDLEGQDDGLGGMGGQIRDDRIQHGAEGLVLGVVPVVGRVADGEVVAVDQDHVLGVVVPRRADIQRADAGVELLLDEVLLAGHDVEAGVPAALHVGGAGVMGAGDVELGEVALVRQQAHPVGVLVRLAHTGGRVPVQDLDAPAEGVVALDDIAALLPPGVPALTAVVLGVFEVILRGEVEVGVHVPQEEGLRIAVAVLLQVEPLRGRAALELPDVQIAAGLFAAALDVPVPPVLGLTEVLALDADVGDAVGLGLLVLNVELVADAELPGLDVVAVGGAAVLRRQLPLGGGNGHALAVLPLFGGGEHDVVAPFQVAGRSAGGAVGGRCPDCQVWQQHHRAEKQ